MAHPLSLGFIIIEKSLKLESSCPISISLDLFINIEQIAWVAQALLIV